VSCCVRNSESGSILIMAAFVLLMISILCGSYWKLLQSGVQMASIKGLHVKTYYAARGAVERAFYELREKKSDSSGNIDLENMNLSDIFEPITASFETSSSGEKGVVDVVGVAQGDYGSRKLQKKLYAKCMGVGAGKMLITLIQEQ
jgi:type II secretory pathway component PulK